LAEDFKYVGQNLEVGEDIEVRVFKLEEVIEMIKNGDFVQGAMLAVEKHPEPDPFNIGSDEEVSIKELLFNIIEITGRKVKVIFDTSKPAGAPRRCPDISKARKLIGYNPEVKLKEGLKHTIEWYLKNKERFKL